MMIDNTYFRKVLAFFILFFLTFCLIAQTAFGAVVVLDDFNFYTLGNLTGQGGWVGNTAFQVITPSYEGQGISYTLLGQNSINKSVTPATKAIFTAKAKSSNTNYGFIGLHFLESGTIKFSLSLNGADTLRLVGLTTTQYDNYLPNVWYDLVIEIDADTNSARVKNLAGVWQDWKSATGDFSQINEIEIFAYSNDSDIKEIDYITFEDLYVPPPDIYGCMDSEALNYNPEATIDDGGCLYAEPPAPETPPATDTDSPQEDGLI